MFCVCRLIIDKQNVSKRNGSSIPGCCPFKTETINLGAFSLSKRPKKERFSVQVLGYCFCGVETIQKFVVSHLARWRFCLREAGSHKTIKPTKKTNFLKIYLSRLIMIFFRIFLWESGGKINFLPGVSENYCPHDIETISNVTTHYFAILRRRAP